MFPNQKPDRRSAPSSRMQPDLLRQGVSDNKLIQTVADQLSAVHGTVVLRHEASGAHLYMACPRCLDAYGRRELKSKHLAFNVEKYLNIGRYADSFSPGKRESKKGKGYAQCMKEHGRYTFVELVNWKPTVVERGFETLSPVMVTDAGSSRYLVPDQNNVMIPDHPGKVISITNLPHTHPAMEYLESRDYDPVLLYQQFRASWCVEEAPEGKQYNRWYRSHPGGWKSTPKGRIIFYSMVHGVQLCWQGRYLEMEHESGRYVWHPYTEQWELRPEWEKGEEPHKYLTATAALRNQQLCGYDAVCAASAARGDVNPVCVITEGPLDAARFPGHGLAVLGKSLSDYQALLVAARFRRAVIAFDADQWGEEATVKAEATLRDNGIRTERFFTPEEYRSDGKIDAGKMGYAACAERLHMIINRMDNHV